MIWDRRERFLVTKTPVRDAVQEAMRTPGRPVVLADGADSPSAGANGDGNDLLRELVRIGYQGQALLAIADPAAAEACHVAGVGATVTVALGGALTPSMYRPVEVTGVVEALRDGRYLLELPVRPVDIGPTAVVRIGDMRVVVSTRKAFHLDESVFHQAGLDPRSADIVQAKSAGGFRGVYEAFAARIIEMDTAGLTSHDLTSLPFRILDRADVAVARRPCPAVARRGPPWRPTETRRMTRSTDDPAETLGDGFLGIGRRARFPEIPRWARVANVPADHCRRTPSMVARRARRLDLRRRRAR